MLCSPLQPLEKMVPYIVVAMILIYMHYIQIMEPLNGNIKQDTGYEQALVLAMMELFMLFHLIVIFMHYVLMER